MCVCVFVCLFVSSLESYQVYHFLHKQTTKTNFYIDILTPNSSTIGSRLCWMHGQAKLRRQGSGGPGGRVGNSTPVRFGMGIIW